MKWGEAHYLYITNHTYCTQVRGYAMKWGEAHYLYITNHTYCTQVRGYAMKWGEAHYLYITNHTYCTQVRGYAMKWGETHYLYITNHTYCTQVRGHAMKWGEAQHTAARLMENVDAMEKHVDMVMEVEDADKDGFISKREFYSPPGRGELARLVEEEGWDEEEGWVEDEGWEDGEQGSDLGAEESSDATSDLSEESTKQEL